MEEKEILYTIILRHDTSTQWLVNNPVLAMGEYGVEDDTHRIKRGDGVTPWDSLTYETFGITIEDVTAENLAFDNSDTDLEATNVEDAILELYEMVKQGGGGSDPEDEERIRELEEENALLREQISQLEEENATILEENDELIAENAELETQNDELQEENQEAEKVVDEIIGETDNNESEGE